MLKRILNAILSILTLAMITGMIVVFMLSIAGQRPAFISRDLATLDAFAKPPGTEAVNVGPSVLLPDPAAAYLSSPAGVRPAAIFSRSDLD